MKSEPGFSEILGRRVTAGLKSTLKGNRDTACYSFKLFYLCYSGIHITFQPLMLIRVVVNTSCFILREKCFAFGALDTESIGAGCPKSIMASSKHYSKINYKMSYWLCNDYFLEKS